MYNQSTETVFWENKMQDHSIKAFYEYITSQEGDQVLFYRGDDLKNFMKLAARYGKMYGYEFSEEEVDTFLEEIEFH